MNVAAKDTLNGGEQQARYPMNPTAQPTARHRLEGAPMNQVALPPSRLVVGTREQVTTALQTAYLAGLVVSASSQLRPVPGDALGRVYARARLLEPVTTPVRRVKARRSRRAYLIAGSVLAVLAILGGLAWAVVSVVSTAVHAVAHALPAAFGVLVIVGLLFAAGQAGVCPGIHCPGCRHNK